MTIKPIRSERDHQDAVARIEQIFSAEPGTDEFDELDVLATLVDQYEQQHYNIDPPTPVEAIKFRMEQGQLKRDALAEVLGSRAKVTEVLQRKRALSKVMIVRLHRRFAISYDVLLGDVDQPSQPSPPRKRASTRTKNGRRHARRADLTSRS